MLPNYVTTNALHILIQIIYILIFLLRNYASLHKKHIYELGAPKESENVTQLILIEILINV
jgi:hypothetical protein